MSTARKKGDPPVANQPDLLDEATLQQGKELVTWLIKTFSQIKLYSLDHPNVRQFIDTLSQKFGAFFAQNPVLELEVTDTAFLLGDKKVHEETQLIRSLPFFFYKDGVTRLSFHEGLTQDELIQFFQLLEKISHLPPEESDIVVSLWEMDFPHIDYLAPDEFLETKIGQETRVTPYKVARNFLEGGTLHLAPEDQAALQKYAHQRTAGLEGSHPSAGLLEDEELLPSPARFQLRREESDRLEILIHKHRELSQEEETIHLLVETIYLEEKIQPFTQVLQSLSSLIEETLSQGKVTIAVHALDHLLDLEKEFRKTQPEKLLHLNETLRQLKEEKIIPLLIKSLEKMVTPDFESLFHLLEFIGPSSLSLVGRLIDNYPDKSFQELACAFIQKIGLQNLPLLLEIADDHREKTTLVILRTIANSDDPRKLSYLARFLRSRNLHIQLETISLFSSLPDPKAAKLILPLLDDPQLEVRQQAARALVRLNQPSVSEDILNRIQEKSFNRRSLTEKKALFAYLFRLKTPESRDFLKGLLKKPWWWSPATRINPGLWLIDTLKEEDRLEVEDFLNELGLIRNRKIRRALQGLKYKLKLHSHRDKGTGREET
ncbi:hypothetical protein NLC35_00110 [Candidatus Aminicenantes bacterium AC-334-K16]|jgi:hypothetical protein|nr:hypothetical protein [Candidatus Aminicenantes bacterium AC-334-K16]